MAIPASVAQIGDYPWVLLPHQIFLKRGETYTARGAATVGDCAKNCPTQALTWHFTITSIPGGGQGHTSIPLGGGRFLVGETQAITRSTVPVGPPVDGQPQLPQPDAELPTSTHTAPLRWSRSQGESAPQKLLHKLLACKAAWLGR